MTEPFQRGVEDQVRRIGLFEIRRNEQGGRPAALDLGRRSHAFRPRPVPSPRDLGASACDRWAMAKPTPWVDPVTITTRPFTPRPPDGVLSCDNFGLEIPIVKIWKFHTDHDIDSGFSH